MLNFSSYMGSDISELSDGCCGSDATNSAFKNKELGRN